MQKALANIFAAQERSGVWNITEGFYAYREGVRFGVFMFSDCPEEERWYDSLSDLSLEINKSVYLSGQEEKKAIFFSCSNENRDAIARFVEQCCNLYANRAEFLADPKAWWESFKSITGDSMSTISTGAFFAEFATWLYLKKTYHCNVNWGSRHNAHDIQSDDGAQHEVKSSKSRNSSIIELSNRVQNLSGTSPFYYYFCRIEEDRQDGLSINDLINFARGMNCDMNAIEEILEAQKIFSYSDERRKKFFIMDFWRYNAKDSSFPCITFDSFKEDVNINAISTFKYSINLDALTHLREDLTEQLRLALV